MPWPRPVPTVGDRTSSEERAADPKAWAFPAGDVDAFYRILASRRDVRRYRPDPLEPGLLRKVLAAAHAAPSVGHSQPWRFVVVQDPRTRQRAATLADEQRIAQAAAMDERSGRHLLDLDLEGIREAPAGIVVCCDRRVPGGGVLGRATFADADLWSCACAIENLWLAARAEGLGVGWVTLFRPDDLARLVDAPERVSTLGWLCIGWPDERPPEPGLQRFGWSSRAPLDDVVLEERWPAGGGPAAPVSRLAAEGAGTAPAGAVPASPTQAAVVAAHDERDRLLTPPRSLGALDVAVDRVCALGLAGVDGGTLVLAAADHPVAGLGVSAYGQQVTRHVAEAAVAGQAVGSVAARHSGLAVVVVDAGVDGAPLPHPVRRLRPAGRRGDLAGGDAMTPADCERLVAGGRRLGAEVARRGLVVLGEVGVGNTTVAAALAAILLDLAPERAVGLGAGADRAMVGTKAAVVAAAAARIGSGRTPLEVLAASGGPEIAVLAGVVLGAGAGGAAIVLDGLATTMAAVVATRLEPAVAAHLVAGQRSREAAHREALAALGLEPLLDLRIRAGEGAGAALAAGLLINALRIRRDVARVEAKIRPEGKAGIGGDTGPGYRWPTRTGDAG